MNIIATLADFEKSLSEKNNDETIMRYRRALNGFKNHIIHYKLFPFTRRDAREYVEGLIRDSKNYKSKFTMERSIINRFIEFASSSGSITIEDDLGFSEYYDSRELINKSVAENWPMIAGGAAVDWLNNDAGEMPPYERNLVKCYTDFMCSLQPSRSSIIEDLTWGSLIDDKIICNNMKIPLDNIALSLLLQWRAISIFTGEDHMIYSIDGVSQYDFLYGMRNMLSEIKESLNKRGRAVGFNHQYSVENRPIYNAALHMFDEATRIIDNREYIVSRQLQQDAKDTD